MLLKQEKIASRLPYSWCLKGYSENKSCRRHFRKDHVGIRDHLFCTVCQPNQILPYASSMFHISRNHLQHNMIPSHTNIVNPESEQVEDSSIDIDDSSDDIFVQERTDDSLMVLDAPGDEVTSETTGNVDSTDIESFTLEDV